MNPLRQHTVRLVRLFVFSFTACAIVACGAGGPPAATPTAAPPTATVEPTARPETVALGKATFIRVGCVACHHIKGLSDQAVTAPPFDNAYQLMIDTIKMPEYKKAGGAAKTARERVVEAIADPNLFVYPKCPQGPCIKGTMPENFKQMVQPDEMNAIVDFILSLGR